MKSNENVVEPKWIGDVHHCKLQEVVEDDEILLGSQACTRLLIPSK